MPTLLKWFLGLAVGFALVDAAILLYNGDPIPLGPAAVDAVCTAAITTLLYWGSEWFTGRDDAVAD